MEPPKCFPMQFTLHPWRAKDKAMGSALATPESSPQAPDVAGPGQGGPISFLSSYEELSSLGRPFLGQWKEPCVCSPNGPVNALISEGSPRDSCSHLRVSRWGPYSFLKILLPPDLFFFGGGGWICFSFETEIFSIVPWMVWNSLSKP